MTIRVHIERLVLEGLPLGVHEGPLVQAAVETELAKSLARGESPAQLTSNKSTARLTSPAITTGNDRNPAQLGRQIASAVYEGLTSQKRLHKEDPQ